MLKIELMQKITSLYIFTVNVLIYLVAKSTGLSLCFFVLFFRFLLLLALDRFGLLGRELTFMSAYCLKSDKLKLLFLKKICVWFFSQILMFLKLFMEL